MAGRKELRSIRFRAETTPGTPVAPRYIWRGNGDMPDDAREVENVEEEVGIVGGTDRTYIAKWFAEADMAETPVTFEQIGDILLMAGFGTSGGNQAGSAQGANGSTTVQTLIVPSGTFFPVYSYTMEAGDNAEAEQLPYTLATEINIKGAGGEALMVSGKLMARYGTRTNAVGSFSNVGTIPAVEDVLASRGSMWLTPVGSGWGTGQVTAGNILGIDLTIKSAWEPKFTTDGGNLFFNSAVLTNVEIEGEFTFEHQTSGTYGAAGSAGQKEKWRNQTPQLWRAVWPGGTILSGTTYANKLLQIDLPIKYSKFEPLDDQNGNDIVTAKWFSKYNLDTPAAGRGTITIVRLGTSEFAGA